VYNNVAAAVGVIVTDVEGKVLFVKRAKEPKKGLCGLPGGFADP
jgi:ADP-ribose pyrophosphatase YjhB (NUDIX family)